jgi:uncharacterized protein YggE
MNENTSLKKDGCCCEWRSPRIILGLIAMILLSAIVIASILRDRIVNQTQWQISITGQGKVEYLPDIANISMGVQVDKAEKAEDALKQLDEKMKKIFEAVQKAGIPKEDIDTQNYVLAPHYDAADNVLKLAGYDANQIIVVKTRDIQKNSEAISKIVSAAGAAGVNQINGISFEASGLNELKQEARLKAIADARGKAGMTARALGIKLCKVVGMWENFISPEGQIYYSSDTGGLGKGGGGGEPIIPSGTNELIVEVNVSYKIK